MRLLVRELDRQRHSLLEKSQKKQKYLQALPGRLLPSILKRSISNPRPALQGALRFPPCLALVSGLAVAAVRVACYSIGAILGLGLAVVAAWCLYAAVVLLSA